MSEPPVERYATPNHSSVLGTTGAGWMPLARDEVAGHSDGTVSLTDARAGKTAGNAKTVAAAAR